MAWETRNGKRYFYLSQRLPGGQVRKKYYGSRFLAEIESIRLEQRKSQRNAQRHQLVGEMQRTAAAEKLLNQQIVSTNDLSDASLLIAGFHNPKSRGWRLRRMTTPPEVIEDQQVIDEQPGQPEPSFPELVARARQGDRSAISPLRKMMLANPMLAKQNGDLASQTHIHWIDLIAGRNLHYRECLLHKSASLKKQLLAESNRSTVALMLTDQAISTWLQLYYHENREAVGPAESIRIGEFRLKKIDSAFKRHMMTLSALSTVKALAPVEALAPVDAIEDPPPIVEPVAPVEVPTGKPAGKRRSAPKSQVRTPLDRSVGKPHESIKRSGKTPATKQQRGNRHHGQPIENECSTAAEYQLEHSV